MPPNTDAQRTYNLDALGNWKNTAFTPVGDSEGEEKVSGLPCRKPTLAGG